MLTGKATITIDGEVIATEDGATLNPGGKNREPESHGGRAYYKESSVPPTLECSVLHDNKTDIVALSAITGATVRFEADTGQRWIMRKAFTTEPVTLDTSTGKCPLKMSCEKLDKAN